MATEEWMIPEDSNLAAALRRLDQKAEAIAEFKSRVEELPQRDSYMRQTQTEREHRALEMLRIVSAGYRAGNYNEAEFTYQVSFYVENLIHGARYDAGQYDKLLTPISEQVRRVEREHGLEADEFWPLGEGPEEYQELNRQYEAILDRTICDLYREVGYPTIADMLEQDRLKFEELQEVGRKSLFDNISQVENLRYLIDRYRTEAELASSAGAYYGACVLMGATLEAVLLLLCYLHPEDTAAAVASLPASVRPRSGDPSRWGLQELTHVASLAGWLAVIRTDNLELSTAGIADFLRILRNLVHPANHLRERPRVLLGDHQYEDAKAAFTVIDALLTRLLVKVNGV